MKFDFDSLLTIAQRTPPEERIPTATGFSGWVFKLYNEARQKQGDETSSFQKHARFCEQEISEFLLWYCPDRTASGWALEFADPLDNSSTPYLASALTINGEPLRCIPDVVLQHQQTGNIIIIERKVTRVPLDNVPKEGWPNMLAQLWCYRWIDNWQDAPKIFLVGDIWHYHKNDGLSPKMRITQHWDEKDKRLHTQMNLLFNEYGGHFSASSRRVQ